ncbi:diguanylate cyclase [Clostridiaceae bacterium HSG29]|nr:diguanylate cyclase [Clostridiaceae bacterium HSG29]
MNIMSGYPYTDVEEVFDLDGLSANEVFDYINENIEVMKSEASESELADGWESDLSSNLEEKEVIFTRDWPVIIDGIIHGIYQSGFDLIPLEDLFNISYENDNLVIVDAANQLVYDNGNTILDIQVFSQIDINNLDSFENNPYGAGYYRLDGNELIYILDMDSTNWKFIYIVNQNWIKKAFATLQLKYAIYIIFTLIFSFGLMRIVNVANRKRIQEEKKLLSSLETDHLTGALNRKMLDVKFDEFIAAIDDKNFCVAMLDIDDFKIINDTYGHGFGDEVLKQITRTIKNSLRENDIVSRFGGEKFVILLYNTNITLAEDICNRIVKNIKHDTNENLEIIVTASIGLVNYTKNHTSESILKLADDNLYKAKKNGKNQVIVTHTVS